MTYYPSNVILETASVCNLKCKGCAFHGPQRFTTRSPGLMDESVWKTAILDIGSWKRKINLSVHGGGEPLLHPQLRSILTYAKSFTSFDVGFLTNGMLLNRDWAEFLVLSEIEWVAFSIDGINPDTHRKVRKKSDIHIIEQNLQALINIKKNKNRSKPFIMLNMVAYDEIIDQRQLFLERWINKVDSITISHYRNPPDSRRWPIIPVKRKPCFLLWSQMIIASDGRMGLCCEDFNIDFPLGNITETSLLKIWNGKEISKVRSLHEQGRYDIHPMCSVCDTWADDIVYENNNTGDYIIKCRASQIEYRKAGIHGIPAA
ncbi:SPASM domain-containing protein [Desulfobacterales bacterium HSG17]|nr:SPASM domain-containing protein [Desulfobacterales bacterium HSG17]